MSKFVGGKAEDIAVDGGKALEAVVFNEFANLDVDFVSVFEHTIDEGFCEVACLSFDAVKVPESGAFDFGGGFGMKVVCEEVLHRGQSSVSSFSHE